MRRLILFVLSAFLIASPAAAWWEYGHYTVGRIGFMAAKPETRAAIQKLIAQSRTLETPECPIRNIEDASYWADCIKTLGDRYSYASPWHYQNVDICKPFDLKAACRDGNCVSAQIERNVKLLADKKLPVRERVMALAFIAHFVGDLHMPLHAGDKGDLGGNRFPAIYGRLNHRPNLHLVWDGHLAERSISTSPAHATGLLAGIAAADRPALAAGTVTDWSRENWEVSRQYAYGGMLPDPCSPSPEQPVVMDEQLVQRLIPVVRQQIAKGGLRLARLLDEALA